MSAGRIRRRPVRAAAISTLVLASLLAAGCGAVKHVTEGNPGQGKKLFVASCGSCHTLAEAGTSGTLGPNLDDAFAADKMQGFHHSTIADVVRGQIAYPDPDPGSSCVEPLKAGNGLQCTATAVMPAGILSGTDAKDVAVYVALCSKVLQKDGSLAADPNCTTQNATVKVPG